MANPAPHAGRRPQTPDERHGEVESHPVLREALSRLLQLTGAAAGWIGLVRPDGELHFLEQAGHFSDAWFPLQWGQTSIWGLAVGDEPTVFNDLPCLAGFGDPPLRNLLMCSLRRGTERTGQLVLANKADGFTSHDAAVLQMSAAFLSQYFVRQEESMRQAFSLTLLRQALDHLPEGVLIVDRKGSLLFANATWGQWTGYAREELCHHRPPFPFWVGQAELTDAGEIGHSSVPSSQGPQTGSPAETGLQACLLPFRRRNRTLFWCQMETISVEVCGEIVRIAVLRQIPIMAGAGYGEPAAPTPPTAPTSRGAIAAEPVCSGAVAEPLPRRRSTGGKLPARKAEEMALLVRMEGSLEFWDKRWEELTGLTRQDLNGVSTELLMDWLFPHQYQRSFVADLFHQPGRGSARALLEVAARTGNCPLLCTFLPVRAAHGGRDSPAMAKRSKCPAADFGSHIADAWLILARVPDEATTEKNGRRRGLRKSSVLYRSGRFQR